MSQMDEIQIGLDLAVFHLLKIMFPNISPKMVKRDIGR